MLMTNPTCRGGLRAGRLLRAVVVQAIWVLIILSRAEGAPGDVTLAIQPVEVRVVPGQTVTFVVQADKQGRGSGHPLIRLSVEDLPPGMTATVEPPVIGTAPRSRRAVVRVGTTADRPLPAGTVLKIVGTVEEDGKPIRREVTAGLQAAAAGTGAVAGRVLAATDKDAVAGVTVTVGKASTTTDAAGNFLITDVPSGLHLVMVEESALPRLRPGGHQHTHPTLVEVTPSEVTVLDQPLYVLDAHPSSQRLTPGKAATIRPAHVPGFRMTIPEGTTILGEDGTPHTDVTVTPLAPDVVPPLPPETAPRTLYLISFGRPGGGIASTPIPIEYPNDLGALPGERIDLYYYDKVPEADRTSHQWKKYGEGTVSEDGLRIVPDPGVGQPKFCITFPNRPTVTDATVRPEDERNADPGDPVDASTGILLVQKTDLVLPGVLPVAITRSYRTKSTGMGPFGLGGSFNFDLLMLPVGATYSYLLPDGIATSSPRKPTASTATRPIRSCAEPPSRSLPTATPSCGGKMGRCTSSIPPGT